MILLDEWAIYAEFIPTHFSHQSLFWDSDTFPSYLLDGKVGGVKVIPIECVARGSVIYHGILAFPQYSKVDKDV